MADVQGVTGDRLKSFIERLETLEDEKRELGEQIKEVFAEAKGEGFDVKVMRQLLSTPAVFDGRNIYDVEDMKREGFNYDSIGRTKVEAGKQVES